MLGSPIREGFHTVTPYLVVPDADKLIDFLHRAFGATETFRAIGSSGGTHVEVQIGDSRVMIGGSSKSSAQPMMLHLYVEDVDAVYQRAIEAGGESLGKPEDGGDGDKRGGVKDLYGNQWYIATYLKK